MSQGSAIGVYHAKIPEYPQIFDRSYDSENVPLLIFRKDARMSSPVLASRWSLALVSFSLLPPKCRPKRKVPLLRHS